MHLSTKLYEQQRAAGHRRQKANTPTSSEEPSKETLPARSYFIPLVQYIMEPVAEKWKRCNHVVGLATSIRTSPTSDLQTTFFSSAHDHHARRLDHSYDGTRPTTPHNENQNIKARTKHHGRSSRDEHQVPTTRSENQVRRSTHHSEKRRTSRVLTPHQIRVENFHEPQAGVDVTTVHTEGQTDTLRRHSDPRHSSIIRNVNDA